MAFNSCSSGTLSSQSPDNAIRTYCAPPEGVQTTEKASAVPLIRAASAFSESLPRPAKAWMQVHVIPFESVISRGMSRVAPGSLSNLDNGARGAAFRLVRVPSALAPRAAMRAIDQPDRWEWARPQPLRTRPGGEPRYVPVRRVRAMEPGCSLLDFRQYSSAFHSFSGLPGHSRRSAVS